MVYWENQIDDIRASFSALYQDILDRDTKENLFEVDPETVIYDDLFMLEDHFKEMGNILNHRPNNQYLGLIEFSTETINLLNSAKFSYKKVLERSKVVINFLNNNQLTSFVYDSKIDGLTIANHSISGTRDYVKNLEEITQQIKLHRECLEKILPKK